MRLGVGLGIAILIGSNVLADQRLDINAGGNLSIEAAQNTQTTAAASTVGAIAGDVNLNAGQTYTQRGSDVVAPGQGASGSNKAA